MFIFPSQKHNSQFGLQTLHTCLARTKMIFLTHRHVCSLILYLSLSPKNTVFCFLAIMFLSLSLASSLFLLHPLSFSLTLSLSSTKHFLFHSLTEFFLLSSRFLFLTRNCLSRDPIALILKK